MSDDDSPETGNKWLLQEMGKGKVTFRDEYSFQSYESEKYSKSKLALDFYKGATKLEDKFSIEKKTVLTKKDRALAGLANKLLNRSFVAEDYPEEIRQDLKHSHIATDDVKYRTDIVLEIKKSNLFLKDKILKWKMCKERNLKQLRILSERFCRDQDNSNIVKIGWSGVGVAGGALTILSRLLPTSNTQSVLTSVGSVACVLGSASVFCTSATELVLYRNSMDCVRRLLKEDQQHYAWMRMWLREAVEVSSIVESMVGLGWMESFDAICQSVYSMAAEAKPKEEEITRIISLVKHRLKKSLDKGSHLQAHRFQIASFIVTSRFLKCILDHQSRTTPNHHSNSNPSLKIKLAISSFGLQTGRLIAGAAARMRGRHHISSMPVFLTVLGGLMDLVTLVLTTLDLRGSVFHPEPSHGELDEIVCDISRESEILRILIEDDDYEKMTQSPSVVQAGDGKFLASFGGLPVVAQDTTVVRPPSPSEKS